MNTCKHEVRPSQSGCVVFIPEENVSKNDGNPESNASELQRQNDDVQCCPLLPLRGLATNVHGDGRLPLPATSGSRSQYHFGLTGGGQTASE